MADLHADRDLPDHDDFDLDAPAPSLWQRLREAEGPDAVADPAVDAESTVPPLVAREAIPRHLLRLFRSVLQSPPRSLHIAALTMGAGKSRRAAQAAEQAKHSWVFVVATHAIADEYAEWLKPVGDDLFVRRGLTGLRIDGKPVCLQHRRALALVQIGVDPKRLCTKCPHKTDYAGTKLPCPALVSNAVKHDTQRIAIYQATRADAAIEALLELHLPPSDDSGDSGVARMLPPESPILVLDDPPGKLLNLAVTGGIVAAVRQYIVKLQPAVRMALEGIVEPVLAAVENGLIASGASLYDVLNAKYASEEAVKEVLRAAWACRQARLSAVAERIFVEESSTATSRSDASADAVGFLAILREASFEPRRPLFYQHDDGSKYLVARAPWVRLLRKWLLLGGRALVLDATCDIYVHRGPFNIETRIATEFSRLGISPKHGLTVNITELHVADNTGVRRLFVSWGSGAKGRHVDKGGARAKEFQGVLRHLATLIAAHGGPVGILTAKPVAAELKNEIDRVRNEPEYKSELLPAELVAHVRAGVEFRVGWYGNHRGQNAWKGVTIHATIGDPNPHIGVTFAEAMALGCNPHARVRRLREAERDQAAGRARPIWESPKIIVHYGRHKPVARWAPQWSGVDTVTLAEGRPPVQPPGGITWAEHERLRLERGTSKRAYAKDIGVAIATYLARASELTTLAENAT
jgi:hypothetical protein